MKPACAASSSASSSSAAATTTRGAMQQQPHAALRRVRLLAGAMAGPRAVARRALCAASSGETITIGDVSRQVKRPQNPELVPVKHITGSLSQSTLEHLRWLLQKDVLGQDVFLIGPPGPLRRSIAMQYMELTKREVEYIALSRDTTEGDLKQRREIKEGSAHYLDQCAVRAALLGRVLVLEGVERAERNVLPVLNNLLENREMQLEDGRFLMSAQRYDKLLQEHSAEQLAAWRVERVSEEFRVVALGLPVPRYRGNPLDPPLRSRFQARNIPHPPFKEQLEILYAAAPNAPPETLAQLLGFATTMLTPEGATLGLPDFPMNSLLPLARILSIVPGYDAGKLLEQAFPYSALLGPEGNAALQDTLKKFELVGGTGAAQPRRIENVKSSEAVNDSDARSAVITALFGDKRFSFKVMTGMEDLKRPVASGGYHETEAHAGLLADMVLSHTTSDFCLLGGKGCGKSILARAFADMLGYHMESIMLYQDMTARELLQQRVTLVNGDTAWRPSPVVTAARDGSLLLLDGIHRVNPGTLALLHRLVHDRELTLYDGSRLIGADRYEVLQREAGLSSEQLTERGVFPIHPAFRVVALAEPAAPGPTAGNPQQWLGPEALSMFLYHTVPPLTPAQEMDILRAMVPGLPQDAAHQLLQLAQRLRKARDPTMRSLAASLSTRQLLRMSRRLARYEGEDLHAAIHKACLSRFLPSLARAALQTAMQDAGLETTGKDSEQADIITEVRDGVLHIGDVTAPVSSTAVQTKVPDILFYDNLQHLRVMEDMLKDFNLGEHLLLVGNQGVGKNKVVDRFLQLLNRPREYLQLHRDTTVQSLTLQPTLRDGVIVYEDSPLVRAVKQGYVLVIDEADKAPVNVTCVLKALVENGEMLLADGRRILAAPGKAADRPGVVSMHADFRMVVLANRPGFPFLGNDFFSAMGDIFACHAVENPCRSSELAMLQRYGPRVQVSSLEKLAAAFGELRGLADAGLAPYPYSTRELVSVVKHLQMFPDDGLWGAVRSVFDFDAYSPEARDMILSTLHKHGIPAGAHPANVQLAKELPLPPPKLIGHWEVGGQSSGDQPWRQCFTEKRTVSVLGPALQPAQPQVAERVDPRGLHFSEEEASWSLKLHEANMACDIAVSSAAPTDMEATTVYVATCNPVGLYALRLGSSGEPVLRHVDLAEVFPRAGVTIWQPLVSVAPLGSHLGGQVLMLEKKSGLVLLLAPEADTVHRLLLWPGEQDSPRPRGQRWWSSKQEQAQEMYCMAKEFSHQNWIVFYKENGNVLDLLHVDKGVVTSIALPINISSLFLVSQDHWLLVESKSNQKFLLVRHGSSATGAEAVYQLKPISEEPVSLGFGMLTNRSSTRPVSVSCEELPSENLSAALGERVTCPNRLLADHSTYATLLLGFPELTSPIEVHAWSREEEISSALPHSSCCFLPATNQIVRALPADLVPTSKLYAPVYLVVQRQNIRVVLDIWK
ncbi:von Willebrand factor A domain-containing protein 8 isoform X3 [Lampetra planeri]